MERNPEARSPFEAASRFSQIWVPVARRFLPHAIVSKSIMKHSDPARIAPSWRGLGTFAPWARAAGCLLLLPALLSACEYFPTLWEMGPSGTVSDASIFDRGPKACPTTCAVANASKHELTLLFGADQLPAQLGWGRVYVDGPGFKAFSECIGDQEPAGDTLSRCLETAQAACVKACVGDETKRATRKADRHYRRDAARRRAREKVREVAPVPDGSR